MRCVRRLILLLLSVCLALPLAADRKKNKKEDVTQVLELPKDLPSAISVDTRRLSFQTAPLISKGLLSAQVRDSLKALWRQHHGAPIVRLRAFVAGTGDSRRVQAIVSEEFTNHHLALPVLTVVQVGALPQENAQLAMESTAVERKVVNPQGVVFLSGQPVTDPNPEAPTGPLLEKSVSQLMQLAPGSQMLSVTCFVSLLPDSAAREALAAKVPGSFEVIQLQRAASRGMAECEGIARSADAAPGLALQKSSAEYSQAAVVNTPWVVFSGAQLGFQNTEADVRLAFSRLEKALEQAGGSLKQAALLRTYPIQGSITEKIRAVRTSFLDGKHPPAGALLPVEGLPSLDAAFAIEAVAVKPE